MATKKHTVSPPPLKFPDAVNHPQGGRGRVDWCEWRNTKDQWMSVADADVDDGAWWVVVNYQNKGRRHLASELEEFTVQEIVKDTRKMDAEGRLYEERIVEQAESVLVELPEERIPTAQGRTITELRNPSYGKVSCDLCIKEFNASSGSGTINNATWRRETKGKVYLVCSPHRLLKPRK